MAAKKSRVEIISTSIVKPSSPTPNDKRRLKLSLFDQLAYLGFVPIIYCYDTPVKTSLTTSSLQKSLSKTLELFYPFAGQLDDDFTFIECNDHGAYFLEARIRSTLSAFLRSPDAKTVTELLPSSDPETLSEAERNKAVTLVQLTEFSCGGIAIALQVSHKIADGFAAACFAKTWADISSGKSNVKPPVFPGPDVLPRPISCTKRFPQTSLQAPLRTRRLVFSVSKLTKLKKEIRRNGGVDFFPSTLEAVSSLLLRCVIAASGANALRQMVNLRRRLTPALPENSIGNFSWPLIVSGESKLPSKLHEITRITRKGLTEFFVNCRDNGLKGETLVAMVSRAAKEEAELVMSGIGISMVTYLSSLGPYETDFGSGDPAWATSPLFFDKRFPMVHSKSGKEIEVWATLEENVMEKFERNKELLAFASFDVPENEYAIEHCRL